MKIVELLKSRKFWAALIGLALIMIQPFAPNFPVSDPNAIVDPLVQLIGVAVVIGSYIVGTAIESAGNSTR